MPSTMPPEELVSNQSNHDNLDPIPVKKERKQNIQAHPFFGMYQDKEDRVVKKMEGLRGVRYDAL